MKAALPGRALASAPKVFVSTTPAELILRQGRAELSAGDRHSPALGHQHRQRRLQARQGRSRVLPGLGPLVLRCRISRVRGHSPRRILPEDFKKIPLSHARSRVLASVPGTDQAAEAVLLAQIPQTARVDKKQIKAPEVQYAGRAAVRADPDDERLAGDEHGQGHHQSRRPLLHVFPGRLVHGPQPERAVGSDRVGAEARSTKFRSARRPTTSRTSPSSRTTATPWCSRPPRRTPA